MEKGETETQKAIEQEAIQYGHGNYKGSHALVARLAYIAGRSKSLEEKEKEISDLKKEIEHLNGDMKFNIDLRISRIRELEEALRELLECDYTSGTHLYEAQLKAKQLLNNH